ncbi:MULTISPECIES: HET-C-related protein [unclassified Pseudomonas]|uniref:HET-C-related protein n=2 Tax=unclassified Pseudomonas TaxID=196821 RepID=UPI002AC92A8C|nr:MULTISPECIES: HET-C-related protein [unclassified Pseudomonas]MEB0040394.1 hypothetical protein [Pseudomonas sp. MH10]MEB0078224.1 hypothetical protein [Pseudomonas sp. MH10out]MEB0093109.1 hypothetical protein [Pseudomonas sp. CCI4.2]MEB0100014.1 hypothetical protein [Pseudomonas sp. CCI3.2]MEB0120895.1 hypothetical protein [Pseudomonas sp. CCI1.2]
MSSKIDAYKTLRFLKLTPYEHPLPGLAGQLHTTYALDQLTDLARITPPAAFALMMAETFGFDIPAHTYFTLQKALLSGNVENPKHVVMPTYTYPADYDNRDRTVRIHPAAIERVLTDPSTSWELLAILLHEFGHHLDNVLRGDLADKNADGTPSVAPDSAREEGSGHAYRMALFGSMDQTDGGIEIATFCPPDADPIAISACYFNAMERIQETQSANLNSPINEHGDREGFEAGSGSKDKHTHQTIEAVLGSVGLETSQVQMAYFGNWLRDYSQLLDPKIVRAATMPKDFPNVLSREALTKIVDVMSVAKFKNLRSIRPEFYTVTPDVLGVYRPSQHIDNPKVTNPTPADPTTRDAEFEQWVMPGDPLLEVDPQTSMKRYIQRSVAVMQDELRQAMAQGPDYQGLKPFGAALHILEDFFAHSNFIELSLIKLGHSTVLPWTSKTDCKWHLPLVTGTFGGTDVISSLAGPIGDVLFSTKDVGFKPTVPGFRSERDQIILILLNEHHDEKLLDIFNAFLDARDQWASLPVSEYVEMYAWFTGTPGRILSNVFNTVMQGMLGLIGNSIDDAQTHFGDDPNTSGSTDPSHSQLSKDHAEHPLHKLAALLAEEAVKRVAQAMVAHWNGEGEVDPVAMATAFFVHPMDCTWQDEIIKDWAFNHPYLVRRSTSKSDLDDLQKNAHDAAEQALKRLRKDGKTVLNFIFRGEKNKESFYHLLGQQTALGPLLNAVKDRADKHD